MNNTAAAGKVAGQAADKDKDKVEKRRALGRGLASLLPGPRAVPPAASPVGQGMVGAEIGGAAGTRTGVSAPHGQSGVAAPTFHSAAGEQQVPHFVRNDNSEGTGTVEDPEESSEPLTIRAQA